MRYLKKFNETKTPDSFIELKSIGCVLDPNEGVAYPVMRIRTPEGHYDEDNGFSIDMSYTEYLGISDEDTEIIETYFKSTEEVVKQNIDWELINSIKELALDYLDKEYKLNIVVSAKMFKVYNVFYSHREMDDSYNRYFPAEWDKFMNVNKPENYYYTIRLLEERSAHTTSYYVAPNEDGGTFMIDREAGIEFADELRKAFPEYEDKIDYGKW